jgi:hypothetical protein
LGYGDLRDIEAVSNTIEEESVDPQRVGIFMFSDSHHAPAGYFCW